MYRQYLSGNIFALSCVRCILNATVVLTLFQESEICILWYGYRKFDIVTFAVPLIAVILIDIITFGLPLPCEL